MMLWCVGACTVFVKSDYGRIKKVYSIWVCTNPSQEMEYSITRYKMTEENLVGKAKAHRPDYDLLDVVMICLGKKTYKELTGLLRLLNLVLMDNYLDSDEKRDTLSKEFKVEITPELTVVLPCRRFFALSLLPGAKPAQLEKCFTVGNRFMSSPVSACLQRRHLLFIAYKSPRHGEYDTLYDGGFSVSQTASGMPCANYIG